MVEQAKPVDDTQGGEPDAALIPVEKWIPHPVSDHGDLEGPVGPVYPEDLSPNDRAAYEQGLSEREQRLAQYDAEQEAAAQQGGDGSKKP